MPNVAYQHKEYKRMLDDWNVIQACLNGSSHIKKAGKEFLPMPNPSDQSDENKARYSLYLDRALFFEFTLRTLEGLVGEVYAKPPIYKLPSRLANYEKNIDGKGTTIDQQTKQAFRYVMSMGRCGLLADYPNVGPDAPATTIADLISGEIRPKVILYGPKDILNWGVSTFGAQTLPSLIVLEETTESSKDGFEINEGKQYRVLRLSANREYFVELWEKDDAGGGNSYKMTASFIPKRADGTSFNYIPFQFIGSVDNTMSCDPAPMAGLARVNIAHYKNSADYEYSVYSIGMPTGVITGLTQSWIDSNYPKKKIPLGSSIVLLLPSGGDFKFVAPEANTMAKDAMEHKEKLAVALGAKLVENRSVERTATEAGLDDATQTSVLGTVAQNVSFAYSSILYDAAQFVDVSVREVEFSLNTDFDISRLSAQERAQLLSEWQSKGITTSEYRAQMREAGIATLDDEEYKNELEEDALNDPLRDPLSTLNIDPITGLPRAVKENLTPEEEEEMRQRQNPQR